MKKLFALLGIVTFPLFGISQPKSTEQTCAVDEQVLLNERPTGVSERNALMLIRGEATVVMFNQKEKTITTSVFPPQAKDAIYKNELRLKKGTATLPVWDIKEDVFYGFSEESINDRLLNCWIICLCISLVVNGVRISLGNYLTKYDGAYFKNYAFWCAISTLLLGLVAYQISLSAGTPSPYSFYRGAFIVMGYITTVLVGWLGAIIVMLTSKKPRNGLWQIALSFFKKKDSVAIA